MPPPPPSLVGTWVTSFIAWFPVDAWQFLPDFAGTRFRRPQTPLDPADPDKITHWDLMWDEFSSASENYDEVKLASLKHPAPFAVLGSFLLKSDGSFQGRLDVNQLERFSPFPIQGTYHVEPDEDGLGGYGGEIILMEDPVTVHFRIKFLLLNKDEMSFITSYRTDMDALTPGDLLQSVAGTMRRTKFP